MQGLCLALQELAADPREPLVHPETGPASDQLSLGGSTSYPAQVYAHVVALELMGCMTTVYLPASSRHSDSVRPE